MSPPPGRPAGRPRVPSRGPPFCVRGPSSPPPPPHRGGSPAHRRIAAIRRAGACIVHVGGCSVGGVILSSGCDCSMHVRCAIRCARGLIGGAIVRRARFAGHQVRAVVRPGRETPGFPAGIEVIAADLRSRESVVEAVRGMDVIVHAATVPYPQWPPFVPLLAENALPAPGTSRAHLVFPGNVYVYG